MKIALPSNDGSTINSHFGRSLGFRILEIDGTKIIADNYLSNNFTGHALGNHDSHSHDNGHQHSHQGIFAALDGVDIVVAGGMGRRLFDEFQQRNIKVYITQESNIEQALSLLMQNNLDSKPDVCCSH